MARWPTRNFALNVVYKATTGRAVFVLIERLSEWYRKSTRRDCTRAQDKKSNLMLCSNWLCGDDERKNRSTTEHQEWNSNGWSPAPVVDAARWNLNCKLNLMVHLELKVSFYKPSVSRISSVVQNFLLWMQKDLLLQKKSVDYFLTRL